VYEISKTYKSIHYKITVNLLNPTGYVHQQV